MAGTKVAQSVAWPKATIKYRNDLAANFRDHLSSVSETLAKHDRVDSVSLKHVEEAHDALARAGLNRGAWYSRPELRTGAGGALATLALSLPGIAQFFVGEADIPRSATLVILGGTLTVGVCLLINGFWIGQNHPPETPKPKRLSWRCWPWAKCHHSGQEA